MKRQTTQCPGSASLPFKPVQPAASTPSAHTPPWSECQGLGPARLCAEELALRGTLPSCYFPVQLLRWMECPPPRACKQLPKPMGVKAEASLRLWFLLRYGINGFLHSDDTYGPSCPGHLSTHQSPLLREGFTRTGRGMTWGGWEEPDPPTPWRKQALEGIMEPLFQSSHRSNGGKEEPR